MRSLSIFAACLLPLAALAGLPLPDHLVYGTIAVDNHPVTQADAEVIVEARKAANGPVIASYRMGAAARLGEFYYELRLELEDAPVGSARAVQVGDTVFLTVRNAAGIQHQVHHLITESGAAVRLDFGVSVDANGDGVPDGWELATLGTFGGDLGRDTDRDGATDRDEYAAGTRPSDATDVFHLALQREDGGGAEGDAVAVSFRALRALGTGFEGRQRFYALESTTNFNQGPWKGVDNASRIPGTDQLYRHREPAGTNAPVFFRARVWLEGP